MISIKNKIDLSDSALMCPTCYELYHINRCNLNIDLQIAAHPDNALQPYINHRYVLHEGNRTPSDVYPKHQRVPALISVPCPHCDVQMIRIDKNIADYISMMNQLGMHTYFSCGGHNILDAECGDTTPVTSPYVVFATEQRFPVDKINEANDNDFALKTTTHFQYNFNGYLSHGFLKRNRTTYATIALNKPFDIIHSGMVRIDTLTADILTLLLGHQLFGQIIKDYINAMNPAQKDQKRDIIERANKYFEMERKFYDENESSIIDNLQRAIDKYHKS